LAGITEMRTNPEMQGALASLGISPRGSTMSVAMQVMNALRQQAQMTPVDQLALVLKKYPVPGVSVEDLMRMRRTGNADWAAQERHFARDRSTQNIPDKTALAWTNFASQMERAGSMIFKTFVTGLLPLEKPLEGFSRSFANFIQVALRKGGFIETEINKAGAWLEKWNGEIASPKFLTDIKEFTSDVGAMARTFHRWSRAVQDAAAGHPGKAITDLGGQSPRSMGESFGEYLRNLFVIPSDYRRWLSGLDKKYGLPGGTLERVWRTESGGDFNAVNRKTGAAGPFQLMPKTAAMFGVDPFNPGKAGEAAGSYLSSLVKHYHGDVREALAAYNWGPEHVDRAVARYGSAWRSHLPAETQAYVMKTMPSITVNNNTGGNAAVIVNGLAQ
ncbi:MAG TPA: lytic transglycosylase domain-containing protein, partial [Steroidobacteraceae bacterium]|nr:lytic transglycosylase domain-containing protein [Steroidobacteraceae bacterium]